jgi:hypothetical protein
MVEGKVDEAQRISIDVLSMPPHQSDPERLIANLVGMAKKLSEISPEELARANGGSIQIGRGEYYCLAYKTLRILEEVEDSNFALVGEPPPNCASAWRLLK